MLDSGAASCMIQDAHRMRHWRGASNIIPWDWCGFPLQGDSVLLFHVVGGQTFSTIHCHTCHDCCRPSNTIVSSAQTIRQWAVQSAFRALSAPCDLASNVPSCQCRLSPTWNPATYLYDDRRYVIYVYNTDSCSMYVYMHISCIYCSYMYVFTVFTQIHLPVLSTWSSSSTKILVTRQARWNIRCID